MADDGPINISDEHPLLTAGAQLRTVLDQLRSQILGDEQDPSILRKKTPPPRVRLPEPARAPDVNTALQSTTVGDASLEDILDSMMRGTKAAPPKPKAVTPQDILSNLGPAGRGPAAPSAQEQIDTIFRNIGGKPETVTPSGWKPDKAELLKAGWSEDQIAELYRLNGVQVPSATKAPPAPARDGSLALATVRSGLMGFVEGVMSPLGSLYPETMKRMTLQNEQDKLTIQGYMGNDEIAKTVLTTGPHMLGELAGSLVPGGPILKGAHAAAEAVTGSKIAQKLLTSTFASTAFTAVAKPDPGESKAAMVGRNMLLFGAMDLGMGMFDKGLREELGAGYNRLLAHVATRTNSTIEEAQKSVGLLRVGAGTGTVETAEAVLNGAKNDPSIRDSKVVSEAQKLWSAEMDRVLPKDFVNDPMLAQFDSNFGVAFDLKIGDQKIQSLHIRSDKFDTTQYRDQLHQVREQIYQAQKQGVPVSIDRVRVSSDGAATRFLNFMHGRDRFGNMSVPPIPGSAPLNTVAETGVVPVEGSKIQVQRQTGVETRTVVRGPRTLGRVQDPLFAPPDTGGAGPRPLGEGATEPLTEAERAAQVKWARIHEPSGMRPKKPGTPTTGRSTPDMEAPEGSLPDELQRLPEAPHGFVWTVGAAGDIEQTPLAQIKVALGKPGEPVDYRPHPYGEERRALVHTDEVHYETQLSVEPYAGSMAPDQNYFRSDFFTKNDPNMDQGHAVRAFFGQDGITLSVTPGERTWEQGSFGPKGDFGWQDEVEQSRAKPSGLERGWSTEPGFAPRDMRTSESGIVLSAKRQPSGEVATTRRQAPMSAEGKARYVDTIKKSPNVRLPQAGQAFSTSNAANPQGGSPTRGVTQPPFRRTAGFVPSAQRTTEFVPDYHESRGFRIEDRPIEEVQRTESPYPYERTVAVRPGAKLGEVKKAWEAMVAKAKEEDAPWNRNLGTWEEFLDRHPELREQKGEPRNLDVRVSQPSYALTADMYGHPEMATAQKAARILMKRGVSGDIPVAVRAAYDNHRSYGSGYVWTLQELADHEPQLISLSRLRDEAQPRGMRILPDGAGVIVTDTEGTWRKEFKTQLDAAAFVTRQPGVGMTRKLEDPIEKELGIGSSRQFDADKDSMAFAPQQLQELATQELVKGKRPMVVLYSDKPEQVVQAVRSLEALNGLPKGTFHALPVPGGAQGSRSAVALYNPTAVQQLINANKEGIARLGVKPSLPLESVIQNLAQKKWGLDAFAGSPAGIESALHYTWLRENGMREGWINTPLVRDSIGSYRQYSPDQILIARRGGPGSIFSGGEPPIDPFTDLSDLVQGFPAGTRMQPPPNAPQMEPERVPFRQESGAFGKMTRYFRVREEMFKDWQANSRVPYWTWYRGIEEGRDHSEAALGRFQTNLYTLHEHATPDMREEAQLVFDAIAQGRDLGTLQRSATPAGFKLGQGSYEVFNRWLVERGIDPDDAKQFLAELPQMRQSGKDFVSYKRTAQFLPKLMTLLSESFVDGRVVVNDREMDLRKNLMRIARAVTNEQEMMPAWRTASRELAAFQDANLVPHDNFDHFKKYLTEVAHTPDTLSVSMQRMVNQFTERYLGKTMFSEEDSSDIVAALNGFNWIANGAFKPGTVLRNLLQTVQTGMILGPGAWKAGVDKALVWARDSTGTFEKELIEKGILTRDLESQRWGDIQELSDQIKDLRVGKAQLGKKYMNMMEFGLKPFKTADDWNKIVAYYSQYDKAIGHARAVVAGDMSFDTFLKKSMVDMRDAKNGPLIQAVQEAFQQGNAELGTHLASLDFMRATQFQYRRGTGPYWMQSTVGRFLGQYGTWPSYFAEFGRNLVARGSVENRLKAVGRWTAANAAMYETAKHVFGVDAARWTFFSPFGYSGGPFAQIGMQGLQAVNQAVSPDEDPVAKIETQRLKSAWQQFVPAPVGAVKDTYKAIDAVTNGNYADGLKKFLGLPEAK